TAPGPKSPEFSSRADVVPGLVGMPLPPPLEEQDDAAISATAITTMGDRASMLSRFMVLSFLNDERTALRRWAQGKREAKTNSGPAGRGSHGFSPPTSAGVSVRARTAAAAQRATPRSEMRRVLTPRRRVVPSHAAAGAAARVFRRARRDGPSLALWSRHEPE